MCSVAKIAFAILVCVAVAKGLVSACWADSTSGKRPFPEIEAAHPRTGAIRAYVMNGLFGELITGAMNRIGDKLRARGVMVQVGSWSQERSFVADACAHRQDRIIFIGHSLGAVAAAGAVKQAKACGVRRVSMVGIDPPDMGAAIPDGTHSVNFVGSFNASVKGAHNVPVAGHGHIAIINDPAMQDRVVAAALR